MTVAYALTEIVITDSTVVDSVGVLATDDADEALRDRCGFGYVAGVRSTFSGRRCLLACIAGAETFIDGLGDLIAYDKSGAIRHDTCVSGGVTTDRYYF